MQKEIEDLILKANNSSFSKYGDSVHISFHRIINSMKLYTDSDNEDKETSSEDFLHRAVPEFQRENNKWTKQMKIKFVENILYGFRTNIILFRIKGDFDYKIIDGLQRTSAILDFLDGKIKVFEKFEYKHLEDKINSFDAKIALTKHTFENWEEAGRFYIDMNENISHSKEDIQKAKDWFLKEKGICL